MHFAICRVLGNEFPPYDAPGSKLKRIRQLVKTDTLPFAQYTYVLNHLIDEAYAAKINKVLTGKRVIEMPFDLVRYLTCPDYESKLRCAVNTNAARNFGIRSCQPTASFVACLDDNQYFTPDEYERIIREIITDQLLFRFRQYYVAVAATVTDRLQTPVVIFRNDATRLFDEFLGDEQESEQLELLTYLGAAINKSRLSIRGDRVRVVGKYQQLRHDAATAATQRELRTTSMRQFLREIDATFTP